MIGAKYDLQIEKVSDVLNSEYPGLKDNSNFKMLKVFCNLNGYEEGISSKLRALSSKNRDGVASDPLDEALSIDDQAMLGKGAP